MLNQLVYEDAVGDGVRSLAKTERNNTHCFSFIQPSQLSCCRRLTGWWSMIFPSYVRADHFQSHSCPQHVRKSLPGMFTPSLSQGWRRGRPTCNFPDPLKGRSDICNLPLLRNLPQLPQPVRDNWKQPHFGQLLQHSFQTLLMLFSHVKDTLWSTQLFLWLVM